MIYTDLTKKAMQICFEAHKYQLDKSGVPYVFHPYHIAEQMTTEETVAVALLHDIVEDTPMSIPDLVLLGFPESVTDAVALLTHNPDQDYMDYLLNIRKNPIARAVKLADLRHNSDLSRLDCIDDKAVRRYEKYQKAIKLLEKNKKT